MKSIFTRGLACLPAAAALALAGAEPLTARPIVVPIIVNNTVRPALTVADRLGGDGLDGASGFSRAEAAVASGLLFTRDGFLAGAADEASVQALADSSFDGDLLTLEVPDSLTLDAWLATPMAHGSRYHAAVPLIDEAMVEAAGAAVTLYDLDRGVASLRVVNFGTRAASCSATTDGGSASFSAESGRQTAFDTFATRSRQEALRISCDQPFYAFATVFHPADGRLAVVGPSPFAPVTPRAEAGLPPLTLVYEKLGLVHAPSKQCGATKKGIVKMPVEETTAIERLVGVLDIEVGPWNSSLNKGGVHSPWWHHRDSPQPFRSNSIMNVNFGGVKGFLRWNQNIDLPKGSNTKAQGNVKVTNGDLVGLQVIHSAKDKEGSVTVFNAGGEILRVVEGKVTGFERKLMVSKGTVLEIGHYCGQHAPEVSFPQGWKFFNMRIEMFVKEAKSGK